MDWWNYSMKSKMLLYILCGIGGFAVTMLILAGGRVLIHGTAFGAGLRDFWNWAIAIMAGISCGYSYWNNDAKKNNKKGK